MNKSRKQLLMGVLGAIAIIAASLILKFLDSNGFIDSESSKRAMQVIIGVMRKCKLSADDIAAIGITNQRETTVVWNSETGEPYHNALVWQDTRTDKIVSKLAEDGGQDRFRSKVGLPLATYFSGPKLKWLLDNVDELRKAVASDKALFGNIDSWIIWNITGGPNGGAHVTDVTNASRTMLMDL